VFKGFDEVRRLGLTHDSEAVVRATINKDTAASGALIVPVPMLEGQYAFMAPGDVLQDTDAVVILA
jgi:hypothetical protein